MNTYGRFRCVERSIKMWLEQDYEGPSELIVYSTDDRHPLVLDSTLLGKNITVINNNIDLETHLPYTNVGAVRRDSLRVATGEYVIIWDDDDLWLNANIRQCVDGILRHPDCLAWKPARSLFEQPDRIVPVGNTLEASFIIDTLFLRDIGFKPTNGSEHLKWVEAIQYTPQMIVDDNSVGLYCYRWNDPDIAPHKQSGDGVDDPTNFERHKLGSTDFPTRSLTLLAENSVIQPHYEYYRNNLSDWNPELIEKYVRQYL